jgi:hypothetical protein
LSYIGYDFTVFHGDEENSNEILSKIDSAGFGNPAQPRRIVTPALVRLKPHDAGESAAAFRFR